jgi:hypothetical protein
VNASTIEYVGFKMPLLPLGMKITTEIENFPRFNETTGAPLEKPQPFAVFNVKVQVCVSLFFVNCLGQYMKGAWLY